MEIQFDNVSFRYESRQKTNSVKRLNFTIHSGELILICGSSGSGKSTVGRIINGLTPGFYRGELTGAVTLNGKDIREIPQVELARSIGSVFQNPRTQFFDTNSTGELAFGCENMGFNVEQIKERICNAVEQFDLMDLLNRDIFNLSGGEKQKIACGSVYAVNPDVYVFDEPSSNLDFMAIQELSKIMEKLKASGKTIILIEHRIYYAAPLADRVFFMAGGEIERIFSQQEFLTMDTQSLHKLGLRSFMHLGELLPDIGLQTEAVSTAINVCRLKFQYGKQGKGTDCALNLNNLNIPSGKVIALIGPNGAGKSTFLQCICGLQKKADALINGAAGKISRKQLLKDSYLVMQDVNHQLFAESVKDELLLSNGSLTKENCEEILSAFDLNDFSKDHPMSLSGGQKQRVAVAAACAAGKKYVYLDEPTSGLDYLQMKNMSCAMKELKKKVESILIVTHDPEFILKCCDYVLHLENGTIKYSYDLDNKGRRKLLKFFNIL